MCKIIKIVVGLLGLLAMPEILLAQMKGKGEITGVVYEARIAGERNIFRLNISSQKTFEGIAVDTPNVFVYSGENFARISEGDVLMIKYDSENDDGIIAAEVSFITDREGDSARTKTLSIIITISGMIFGVLLVLGGILYQKRRVRG